MGKLCKALEKLLGQQGLGNQPKHETGMERVSQMVVCLCRPRERPSLIVIPVMDPFVDNTGLQPVCQCM